jgi:2-polyprenyl-3-methyl-5-hydroxy-6-metoxy-1,4-benzoquinol methylase
VSLAAVFDSSPWAESSRSDMNWINWRAEIIVNHNESLIAGKRVLDLACGHGRMSYACLKAGASSVVGLEGRQVRIDEGKRNFATITEGQRMTFVQSDLFSYLEGLKPDDFDVIMCLGFLYHTVRQVDFFRICQRLRPSVLVVDTCVSKNYWWYGRKYFGKPPALFLVQENASVIRDTLDDDGLALWPTVSFLEMMFKKIGYAARPLHYRGVVDDWTGLDDYKRGLRVSYVATPIR